MKATNVSLGHQTFSLYVYVDMHTFSSCNTLLFACTVVCRGAAALSAGRRGVMNILKRGGGIDLLITPLLHS